MSSTQALVNLVSRNREFFRFAVNNFNWIYSQARVAKEAEIQQILKGPQKRPNKSQAPSTNQTAIRSQQSPSSNPNASPQNRLALPNVPSALQYMSLQQKASSLLTQSFSSTATNSGAGSSSNNSSDETSVRPGSPLDLSASTPAVKRMKLESPSPSRSLTSPNSHQSRNNTTQNPSNASTTNQRRCHAQNDEINSWSVSQVCEFVSSIDICAEYSEVSNTLNGLLVQRHK